MASNGYGLGYSNTLPGVVRSTYGVTNLGDVSSATYGAVHGEIFNGPQDEKMGIANYVPIVQNLPITYTHTKQIVAMTGELTPLFPLDTPHSRPTMRGGIKPMAGCFFQRGGVEPAVNEDPVAVLPLASDFDVGRVTGKRKTAHAAFSVQAVSDVMTPHNQHERIQALAGDDVFVHYNKEAASIQDAMQLSLRPTYTQVKTGDPNNNDILIFYLGKAFLNFDTNEDKNLKICL